MTYEKGRKPETFGKGKGAKFIHDHVAHVGAACVEWPFSKNEVTGYVLFGYKGKFHYAHRLMCELVHGPAPSDAHEAAHSCGNRICVNPHHLSWKTPAGNQFDRRLHGTMRSGRKLKREQWDEIRALKGQMTQREIAKLYGVTFQNVSAIQRHRG